MINLVPIKTRQYHSWSWTLLILIWIWCKPTEDNVFYHFIRSPNDLQHVISTETVTSAGSSNCLIWLLYHLNHSTKLFHPIIWYPYLSIFQILSSCGLMGRNMYDHLGFVALGYHCYQFWALHWTCSCLLRYLSSSSCLPILSSSYHLYKFYERFRGWRSPSPGSTISCLESDFNNWVFGCSSSRWFIH